MGNKFIKSIIALGISFHILLGLIISPSMLVYASEIEAETEKEETLNNKEILQDSEENSGDDKQENSHDQKMDSVDNTEEKDHITDTIMQNDKDKEQSSETVKSEEDKNIPQSNNVVQENENEESKLQDTIGETPKQISEDKGAIKQSKSSKTNMLKAVKSTSSISLGDSISGTVSDSDDSNVYRFNVTKAGKVTFNMTSYMQRYHFYLYDNSGKEIWADKYNDWNSSLGYINDIYNIYLEKGTYSLEVQGYGGNEKYSLKTAFTSAETNTPEPNNSFSTAVNTDFGATYTGIFAPNDEFDNFHFTLTKSGRVTVQVTSYLESYNYYLYDKSGKELESHTYNRWNESQGYISNNYSHDLEKGDYYIKISATYAGGNGKYKAKFDFKSSNATNTEPDNTYLTGTELQMGKYYYGQIALNDSHDIYTFSLDSNASVKINLTSYMPYCNIRILNDDGDDIWSETYIRWNENQGYISKVYTTSLDAGDYAIQVEQCSGATGTYKILVNDGKERIQLDKTAVSLTNLGQTVQLSATVSPSTTIIWSSSSTKIATVNSTGKVVAKGFGKAVITAKTAKGTYANCTVNVLPARASITKITNPNFSQLKVEWKKVGNVSGYEVYRSKIKNGTYTKVKTVENPTTLSYTNGGLQTGTKYYYKVRAYKNVDSKKVYGTFSPIVSATPLPSRVTGVTTRSMRYDAVEIQWNNVIGSTAYEIYRSESPTQVYKYVKTVSGSSNTKFVNTGLISGKTYYYKIRAYRLVSGEKVYGTFSNAVSRKPIPGKPAIQSVKGTTSKHLAVTWSEISGADGYEVYRSNTSTGTFKRIVSISGGNRLTYTNSGLTANKTYYYKVRAYRIVNGQKVFGLLSSAKAGKSI